MMELLMVLTVAVVLVAVGVLVTFVVAVMKTLERIGGEPVGYSFRASYLGRIAFGVRAIEQQTGHLGPEVTRINEGLAGAAEGLAGIDRRLAATGEAVLGQEGSERA